MDLLLQYPPAAFQAKGIKNALSDTRGKSGMPATWGGTGGEHYRIWIGNKKGSNRNS